MTSARAGAAVIEKPYAVMEGLAQVVKKCRLLSGSAGILFLAARFSCAHVSLVLLLARAPLFTLLHHSR